jgi:hypothetical protein
MKRFYKLLTLSLVIWSLLVLPQAAKAQEPIKVLDQSVETEFRDHITFNLKTESAAEITEVDLLYQVKGQLATSRNAAEFTPGQTIEASYTIDQTKPENYMPPGAELTYWWKIVDTAGNELKTEKETLVYLDNRHDWQTRQNDRLTLYWYEGGDSFGQTLFDRSNQALDTLASDVGISLKDPIKVFIYANHNDFMDAISTAAQEWTGGQAFPTYGVVVMGIEPEQLTWGLRATTHEMSHLVIHQATDNSFRELPRWLDEGIAVYNEDPAQLVEDFRPIFERAVADNQLMTLRSLASPFPSDPYEANLAYGQSGAVVKFIIDTYGSQAMAKLLSIFAEGALDDEALQEALGVNTDGLDNAFRASLNLPPWPDTENTAAPAPVEAVPPPASNAEPAQPTENAAAPAQNGQDSAPAQPAAPPPASASERQSSPLGLPCLAGLIPLAALVVFNVKTLKRNNVRTLNR